MRKPAGPRQLAETVRTETISEPHRKFFLSDMVLTRHAPNKKLDPTRGPNPRTKFGALNSILNVSCSVIAQIEAEIPGNLFLASLRVERKCKGTDDSGERGDPPRVSRAGGPLPGRG